MLGSYVPNNQVFEEKVVHAVWFLRRKEDFTTFAVGVAHVVCWSVTTVVWVGSSRVDSNVLTPIHLRQAISFIINVSLASPAPQSQIHSTLLLSPWSPNFEGRLVSWSWFLCWHNSLLCTWQSSRWHYLWPLLRNRWVFSKKNRLVKYGTMTQTMI